MKNVGQLVIITQATAVSVLRFTKESIDQKKNVGPIKYFYVGKTRITKRDSKT